MVTLSRPRDPRRFSLLCLWVLVATCGPLEALAQSGYYTYEPVADTRSPGDFSDFGFPVLNSHGDVAFAARLQSGGSGIYKYSAATKTIVTIFEDPTNDWFTFHARFTSPAIDDAGRVIFQYEHGVIRIGDGGSSDVLLDSSAAIPLGNDPGPFACQEATLMSRNVESHGQVVVRCLVEGQFPSGAGIYLAGPGALSRVCDTSNAGPTDPACLGAQIVMAANGLLGGIGSNAVTGSTQVLLRGRASALDVLLDPAIDGHQPGFGGPSYLSRMAINSSGRILYSTYQDSGVTGSGYAIYGIDNAGAPFNVTDPRGVYRSAGWPSINNLGELAFLDAYLHGLFNGPDPVANKVMGYGDEIPGYAIPGLVTSVAEVSFEHPGINDAGELVFIAHLGDGTLVIVRAVPPNNHPPDVTLGDQSSPEGTPVLVHVNASDQDGDALSYSLDPGTTPGGIPLVPPVLSIDASGDITGTPTVGTAGNTYAVSVTVTDVRGAHTTVEFLWTITQALPPPRTNLTATANFGAQGIDLAWLNPSPDTATHLTLSTSQTGPGGPFYEWQTFAPDETSYRFVLPTGSGLDLCFTVNGVIDLPAGSIVSANSNIACASYPRFQILPAHSFTPGTTSANFYFSTNMSAAVTVAGLPAGASASVFSLPPNDPLPMSFQAFIVGLPALRQDQSYTVTLVGESIPVGLDATRDVTFNTTAAPNGGGGGPQQAPIPQLDTSVISPRDPATGNFALDPRVPGQMSIEVEVTNDRRAGAPALGASFSLETSLEWRCPPVTNQCLSDSIIEPLIVAAPDPLGDLRAGEAIRPVRLVFRYLPDFIYASGGPARLHVVIRYRYDDGGSLVDGTFRRDLSVLLPTGQVSPTGVSFDLGILSAVLYRPHFNALEDIRGVIDIGNGGPEDVRGVTLDVQLPASAALPSDPRQIFGPLAPDVHCVGHGLTINGENGRRRGGQSGAASVQCTIPLLVAGSSRHIEFDGFANQEGGEAVVTLTPTAGDRNLLDNTRILMVPPLVPPGSAQR